LKLKDTLLNKSTESAVRPIPAQHGKSFADQSQLNETVEAGAREYNWDNNNQN